METFNDLALKCLPLPGEVLTTDVEDNQVLQLQQDSRDIILQKKKFGLSEGIYDRIVFVNAISFSKNQFLVTFN